MLLSIIVHGRNDSYFGDFKYRIQTTLNALGENLSRLPNDFEAEIVLCDWGSPPDDRLINSLMLSDQCSRRLKYVYVHPNVVKLATPDSPYSSSHAVNTAVRRSSGRYVLICDSDVFWLPETMSALYQGIQNGALNGKRLDEHFFWAARYHVPKAVVDWHLATAALFRYVAVCNKEFVSDTPRGQFGGATCAHFLSRKMWDDCTGLDERLPYAGVNDIDIHRRLCMRYSYGGLLDDQQLRFYHLEHYSDRSLQANELNRRRNDEFYHHLSHGFAANDSNWGLAKYDLVDDMAEFKVLVNLINAAKQFKLPYDDRLAPAMGQQAYERWLADSLGNCYYAFLRSLVRHMKPRKILELGTSIGRSALFMMTELPADSELLTVDIGSHRRVDLSGFAFDTRLKIIYGSSLEQQIIDKTGDGIDLLFIDTEHTYEQVAAEWAIYRRKLVDGAIVVFDDIHLNEGMTKFWNQLDYDKVDTGSDLHFSGFGLLQYWT